MKIRFLGRKSGHPTPFIVFDDSDIDPVDEVGREWCIRETIRDDPSMTRESAKALYRQAIREAAMGGV